jgi:hypothetical protein
MCANLIEVLRINTLNVPLPLIAGKMPQHPAPGTLWDAIPLTVTSESSTMLL